MNDASSSKSTISKAQSTEGAPLIAPIGSGAIIDAPNAIASTDSALIDIEHFGKVELRVGQIIAAEKIEKSKKLLKLQVDLGPVLGQRQILSGISQFYTPEILVGRKIVVVANLKPATMMGLESRGMLLAASSPDRTQLNLVHPGDDAIVGSTVS